MEQTSKRFASIFEETFPIRFTNPVESDSRAMYSHPGQHYSDINNTGERVVQENESIIDGLMVELLKSREDSDVITIADYGTADGGNILPLMNRLVERIMETKGVNQEINVVFEDHSVNDFNALVKNVLGHHHLKGLQSRDNVHFLVSPTSMYKQCLPRCSLDFGFCILAIHWLSACPLQMKNEIFVLPDDSNYHVYQAQAKRDWRDFVICRGKELKAGGFFFLSTVVTECSDKTEFIAEVYRQMVRENIITQDELRNTNVSFFLARKEDYTSIFTDGNDPEVQSHGLHLVSSVYHDREYWPVTPDKISNAEFLSTRAAAVMTLFKSWLYNTILCGLSEKRPLAERNAITEEYFDRLRLKILNDGLYFRYNLQMVDIIFQKR